MAAYRNGTNAAFILEHTGDGEYVHVFGEVDLDSEQEFRDALSTAADHGGSVVADLTRCTFIGSQGFAVLAEARSKMRLAVLAPPRIRHLMDVLQLGSLVIEGPDRQEN